MKELVLNHGFVAQVSDEDYGWASQRKWFASRGSDRVPYAGTKLRKPETGEYTTVMLARILLGVPKGVKVRYLDGDSLNCQRDNLFVSQGFVPNFEARNEWK
jgi:hypothetical protein